MFLTYYVIKVWVNLYKLPFLFFHFSPQLIEVASFLPTKHIWAKGKSFIFFHFSISSTKWIFGFQPPIGRWHVPSCVIHIIHLVDWVDAHDKENCHLCIGGWSLRLQTCLKPKFIPVSTRALFSWEHSFQTQIVPWIRKGRSLRFLRPDRGLSKVKLWWYLN